MAETAGSPAIRLDGISKSFGPVRANRDISLAVEKGSIHGIVGENGAGKSTLMSILYGFYQADAGSIHISGRPANIRTPQDAIAAGIGMVHQHFMLVDPFTVLENVILGAEGGLTLRQGMDQARTELIALERDYGLEVSPDATVSSLTVGQQQRVEILKALFRQADILILDEPTGVLTPAEADHLFRILGQLRDTGKTVILITHKLREIMAITDKVSVMRQGEIVDTLHTKDVSLEKLAELMVGRRVLMQVDKQTVDAGECVFEARDLTIAKAQYVRSLDKVSLRVHSGEIVGIAGVAGNGQSELLEVIGGMRSDYTGDIMMRGRTLRPAISAPDAIRANGMAHVPEDRHRMGLVMPFEASENCILGYHNEDRYQRGALLDRAAILSDAAGKLERFDVRPPNPHLPASSFSGGNQQKIVLAREFEHDPDFLAVGQPTRGVDIGAIEFIHQHLLDMRARGKAILLVSVELDEIRALADRIVVMFAGRIVGECLPSVSDAQIGALMAGLEAEPGV